LGVKGWDFIPWRWVDISELTMNKIAIDAFNYMIRRMSTINRVTRVRERIPLTHVSIGLSLIRTSLKKHIIPIFVFDGPPETLKRDADPELIHIANSLYRWYKKEGDPFNQEIAEPLNNSPALRTYFAAQHLKDICSSIGVPVVSASSEAELMCAVMCREGLVGSVASNDMDAILFGSPHVIRSLQLSKNQMEQVTLQGIQEVIDLELEELRDLAIVCGCDFHKKGVPGIGPRKGVVLLRRFGGLEGLLKARGFSYSERSEFLAARAVFDYGNYLTVSHIDTSLNSPVPSRVSRLLAPVLGDTRTESTLDTLVGLWKQFFIVQDTLETWM